MRRSAGVKIRAVEEASPAQLGGLEPGDEIVAVNDHPVPDELALKFHLAEEMVQLEVVKQNGEERLLDLDLSSGATLGVQVEDFRTRTCNNACLFCFIDQLPPGVRPTLQIKDDDYRLSFLHGNYVTLTNLNDRDLDRIVEQALSPQYVSVHATDPELRTRILGRRKADDLDRKMRRLIAGGIRLHTQIVLMPGVNDGAQLEKTVFDLRGYYPGVHSIAVVPLGLSDHGPAREQYIPVTPAFCREVIAAVAPWQEQFRSEIGRTFVYLADEFHLQGGVPLPDSGYYDEFAQIEDGVGMVRRFLDDFERELQRRRRPRRGLRGTLATARLFHPFLEAAADRFNRKLGSELEVRLVDNRFMGKDITVAGLLSGRDLEATLAGNVSGDFVVIPNEAVSRVDGILVDGMAPEDLARRIGKPVHPSGRTTHDFFQLLCERL
jgi:putative radical SAM enzyme (TIGR03279 family)